MLIDDDRFILHSVTALLTAHGITVHPYESATLALSAYQEVLPDLVLTDLNMPGMNGMTLMRQIRHFDQSTPFIFLTGNAEFDLAVEALRLRAFDFLVKPCEADLLVETVQRGIDHKLKEQSPDAANDVMVEPNGCSLL